MLLHDFFFSSGCKDIYIFKKNCGLFFTSVFLKLSELIALRAWISNLKKFVMISITV